MNWIALVCLCLLAVFAFIQWATSGSGVIWIDGFFICLFLIVACVFTGIAPFHWLGITDAQFPFMTAKWWRSTFIIVLSCFFFPRFSEGYWDAWQNILVGIVSLVTLVLGIFLFVLDCISCCSDKTPAGNDRNTKIA